jgi:hypothetical protein
VFTLGAGSPPSNSGNNQSHASGGAQGRQAENRGTEQNPFFVTQLETPQAERSAADIEREDQQSENTNRDLLYATLFLAGVGFLQWIILLIQTIHIGRSTRVAERALTEIERPWLFVHLERGGFADNVPGFERSAYVVFDIANYGKAPAVITKCSVGTGANIAPETLLRDDLRHVIPPDGKKNARQTFPADVQYARFTDLYDISQTFMMPTVEENESLFFYIQIEYSGVSPDSFYQTDCCWLWSELDGLWVLYNQPGYNRRT